MRSKVRLPSTDSLEKNSFEIFSVASKLKPNRQLEKLKADKVLLRRSPRLELLGKNKKETTPPRKRKAFDWDNATLVEIAERVLFDYNKKHGTKLVFEGVLPGKDKHFCGFGSSLEFLDLPGFWKHFNFLAKNKVETLVLFAELVRSKGKYCLTTLSPVDPTKESHICNKLCSANISHPHHGFRAGLFPSEKKAGEPKILSNQAAAELSEFALQCYNKKHGRNLKFKRALKCNSFSCTGILMDFSREKTNWVHMNFEAWVGYKECEKVLRLFAELYLGDEGKFVLATLSPAEPSNEIGDGKWRKKYIGVNKCVFCPAGIHHPWSACRFGFNNPP